MEIEFKFTNGESAWGNVSGFFSTDTKGISLRTDWGECFVPLENIEQPASVTDYLKKVFDDFIVGLVVNDNWISINLENEYVDGHVEMVLKPLGKIEQTFDHPKRVSYFITRNDISKIWGNQSEKRK